MALKKKVKSFCALTFFFAAADVVGLMLICFNTRYHIINDGNMFGKHDLPVSTLLVSLFLKEKLD